MPGIGLHIVWRAVCFCLPCTACEFPFGFCWKAIEISGFNRKPACEHVCGILCHIDCRKAIGSHTTAQVAVSRGRFGYHIRWDIGLTQQFQYFFGKSGRGNGIGIPFDIYIIEYPPKIAAKIFKVFFHKQVIKVPGYLMRTHPEWFHINRMVVSHQERSTGYRQHIKSLSCSGNFFCKCFHISL